MSIKVVFKNVDKSDFAESTIKERFSLLKEKFPEIARRRTTVTLSMDNSPKQAGPDLYGVKVQLRADKNQNIIMEKTAQNPYQALHLLFDRIHERLIRFDEKKRRIKRGRRRHQKQNYVAVTHEESQISA